MKNINEIQRQIEKKAKDELHGLIDEFVDKLKHYKATSYAKAQFPSHSDMSGLCEMSFGNVPEVLIDRALVRIVDAVYLEPLVEKKTDELLTKLEMI